MFIYICFVFRTEKQNGWLLRGKHWTTFLYFFLDFPPDSMNKVKATVPSHTHYLDVGYTRPLSFTHPHIYAHTLSPLNRKVNTQTHFARVPCEAPHFDMVASTANDDGAAEVRFGSMVVDSAQINL